MLFVNKVVNSVVYIILVNRFDPYPSPVTHAREHDKKVSTEGGFSNCHFTDKIASYFVAHNFLSSSTVSSWESCAAFPA